MSAVIAISAVLIDLLLGEPRRWHPLVAFGQFASRIERWLRSPGANPNVQRLLGIVAVVSAVVPCVAFVIGAEAIPGARILISVGALYFAIGHRSLHEHARAVQSALQRDDLPLARHQVARMVSRDTAGMDASRIAAATVESVLENGNDAVFGALFWFAILGAPGTIVYRLVNTLDAMWGYRSERYFYFGWAAARLDDALNFVPARLTALSYAALGQTAIALRCWRTQAPAWDSPNAGPVMASGAGALGLRLGGGAWYHGIWTERSILGEGDAADAAAIARASKLVTRTVLLWLSMFGLLAVVIHA